MNDINERTSTPNISALGWAIWLGLVFLYLSFAYSLAATQRIYELQHPAKDANCNSLKER